MDERMDSRPPVDPNLDVARWDHLIESIGPDSVLVVIAGWMGTKLRQVMSPEDVWQETLLQAWRDREKHSWEDVKKFRRWILAIARNRIHDAAEHAQAQKRGGGRRAAEFSSLADSQGPSASSILPGRSTTPSRIASHREHASLMESALGSLPPEQEVIVRRYLFEEDSMERIAKDLEIPVSTAWYRFRKGSERYARELSNLRSRVSGEGS